MFLKISEFKKAMKSTLKTSGGLVIRNVKGISWYMQAFGACGWKVFMPPVSLRQPLWS